MRALLVSGSALRRHAVDLTARHQVVAGPVERLVRVRVRVRVGVGVRVRVRVEHRHEDLHVLRRVAAGDGGTRPRRTLQPELDGVGRDEQRALSRLQPCQALAVRYRAGLAVGGRRPGAARDLKDACCGGGVQLEP